METLTPQYLEELLFDDIPWVDRIQDEHDSFAAALRERGCEVYYYCDLLADILNNNSVRTDILNEVLKSSSIPVERLEDDIRSMLSSKTTRELAEILISGLRKEEVPHSENEKHLSYYIKDDFPFYINPLPNLYFTRDPGAIIAEGIVVSTMKTVVRSRETLILDHIRKHHPLFAATQSIWYSLEDNDSIEGGDILVPGPETVIVGCSVRTSSEGIEKLTGRLFQGNSGIKRVLVLQIPAARAYMHLDTVFTMLDVDKFAIFPGVENHINVFELTPGKNRSLSIKSEKCLKTALRSALKLPAVQILHSGGDDRFTAAREQWNDSTNTLALAPGVVVTYKRNVHSNNTLRRNGIDVVEIEGSELVRGRGGPRCMSMPLDRSSLD